MFAYNFSKKADNLKFKEVCEIIENSSISIFKEELLIDVDGSVIQIYNVKSGKIKVFNDYEVDAVYIDSDVCLDELFI